MDSNNDISREVLQALRRIIRAIDLQSRHLIKQFGLTGPQLVVLEELQMHPNITVGGVAKNVALSQATVTNIVDRLEYKGYVQRYRSTRDKRCVFVQITELAVEKLKENPSLLQQQFLRRFNNLDEWEQTLLLSSLQRIVSMMNAEEMEVHPVLFADAYTKDDE